ncbi:patatin-like phospholipase family protein [Pradoshia sp.]
MKDPKIGLALGSGGARGFAHIGLLKELDKEGIQVDCIAGSSMGALMGSFYASGSDLELLEKVSMQFKRKYFLDWTVPKMGFVAGKKIEEYIRLFTKNQLLENLSIPLAVIATDIERGEKVIFREGPIYEAVRASIAVPGIFVPKRIGGRLLVDGGVVDRVPVSVAQEMGADIVIASDVSSSHEESKVESIYDVIMKSLDILQMEVVKARGIKADVTLDPAVQMYNSMAFTNIPEIIAAGEEEARKRMPEIKDVIQRWKERNNV